ncbi:MAG: hypothetical protein M3R63_18695, partial [Actinomycetota bacterium]|nr:hypothetical protein [Actinomycetota bacterium]
LESLIVVAHNPTLVRNAIRSERHAELAEHSPDRISYYITAANRGQRSAMVAFRQLREHCAPPVVALVGIAGGIHRELNLGDVVVSTEVVYYDMRKETAAGVQRRGQSQQAPPVIGRKINAFFTRHGEPLRLADPHGTRESFQVVRGPIGSGEAVVAHQASEIRHYLECFNNKVLAVETEIGGVAQEVYEELDQDRSLAGWLTVRGISDLADAMKDDAYHGIAARHAAETLMLLLPFLPISEGPA